MTKQLQKIGEGYTAEVFLWDSGNILKLYREGMPLSICRDEYTKTQTAFDCIAFVPEPKAFQQIDGRHGGIYERITGATMLKKLLHAPWRLGRYAKALAVRHAEVHQALPKENLPPLKGALKEAIDATPLLSNEEKNRIYRYLDTLPEGKALCHYDFHPGNIIISNDKLYTIDWMTACRGHHMADLARTKAILTYSAIPGLPKFFNIILSIFQKRLCHRYLAHYLTITKENAGALEIWELPVAAARLREWIPDAEKAQLLTVVKQALDKLA